ncbi:MAG: OpgC domain-containing protein [Chloroflexi bacterium]|nr:OpgC domain-containing protein [Chloroflexota bacterium]
MADLSNEVAPAMSLASAKSNSIAQKAKAASDRLVGIDALRGLAILGMSLRHTAYFLRFPLQAETYGGAPAKLLGWPYWVSGLLANATAPTFFFLFGLSLALYVNGRRRAGEDEWAITRFLATRAIVVFLLDVTICDWAWAGPRPYTHVLLSIAIAMLFLSVARWLPLGVLTGFALILVLGYQLFLPVITPQFSETQDFLMALLFSYSTLTRPATEFSVFGWFPLPILGFVLGQYVSQPVMRRPRTWVFIGAAMIVAWFALRVTNVLNEPTPFVPSEGWRDFLIMSKTPPSLSFFMLNLGLSAWALGALYAAGDWLSRPPLQWLSVCGQATLFFFVAHILVYGPMTQFVISLNLPGPPIIYTFIIWFTGLAFLIPLAYYYRRLKRRHPQSFLRYL